MKKYSLVIILLVSSTLISACSDNKAKGQKPKAAPLIVDDKSTKEKESTDAEKAPVKTPTGPVKPPVEPQQKEAPAAEPAKEQQPKVEVETATLTLDEASFVSKIFTEKFDGEFRVKNYKDIKKNDLGIQTHAIIKSIDTRESQAEINLYHVVTNTVFKITGKIKIGEISTLSGSGGITVRAYCADDKCDILLGYAFQLIEKNEDLFGTFILKRSGDKHLPVQFEAPTEGEGNTQEAAAKKAEKNYHAGMKEFGEKAMADLKQKMKADKSWYSAYPFWIGVRSEPFVLTMLENNKFKIIYNVFFIDRYNEDRTIEYPRSVEKDMLFAGEGKIGEPLTMMDKENQREMTWVQKTKNFGWATFKVKNYTSRYKPKEGAHDAYFIMFCGFEPVTVNSATMQIEFCQREYSTMFLDGKPDGRDEGGIE
jgi:hypothetical protein